MSDSFRLSFKVIQNKLFTTTESLLYTDRVFADVLRYTYLFIADLVQLHCEDESLLSTLSQIGNCKFWLAIEGKRIMKAFLFLNCFFLRIRRSSPEVVSM